jgi:hypothetical protein
MSSWHRRRLLKAGLATAATLFALPASSQDRDRTLQAAPRPSSGAAPANPASLLSAPRRALVIGNSAYPVGPLKNPANDAKAIAGELRRQGFEVAAGIDLKRAEMLDMISAYGNALARTKPVALFYFAGHGLQLEWRNYLVPVDAQLGSASDVRAQCVDVNGLIADIAKAANPMNVIILDACRDDPFGRSEQKGLSQFDAPPGTLLAFATSPGNVASDGDDEHGLYTAHLLREMRVPEAKIEDVFKRVRLAVRRQSNGRQIPWESTSLEQDFWFIPPKDLRKLAEEEERAFAEELALWEKADGASTPGPLESYLRRYPSGRFAELASQQLDALLRRLGEKPVQVVSVEGNPFSQGSVRADVDYKVGDFYTYTRYDRDTREDYGRTTSRVTGVTDSQVIFNDGKLVYDRLGNVQRLPDGRHFTPRQDLPVEFAVGKRWKTRYITRDDARRKESETEYEYRITRREVVTVPAGKFDCFLIEGTGWTYNDRGFRVLLFQRRWMAPDKVRRPVVLEQWARMEAGPAAGRGRKGSGGGNDRQELYRFSQT